MRPARASRPGRIDRAGRPAWNLRRNARKALLAPRRRFRYIAADKEIAVARVKMIKPEEADAETRKVYDGVVAQWGRISNFSQVLAHQPAALAGWMLPNEIDPPQQRQIRPGLRADPAARHHQDIGAQSERLLHVPQRAAREEDSGSPRPRSRRRRAATI